MLTRELAIVVYDRDRAIPDRLTKVTHANYARHAARMCELYKQGAGRTRRWLHEQVHRLFDDEEDCPPKRIDAFCKLLDEVSEYERDEKGTAAKLRQQVFRAAAKFHPLVVDADQWFEHQEQAAKEEIAKELGKPWEAIDRQLFADIMEFHRLKEFRGYGSPAALLARYNVAQAQVALFDAVVMTVWAKEDLKSILRYAKLARLMHAIRRESSGEYRFDFNGPASIFSHTHRYGAAMARFLPGLLSCRGWRMQALLKPGQWSRRVTFELDTTCGLTSPVPQAAEFDSKTEEAFSQRWGNEPREGWRLERESEILHAGQKIFVPDFVFVHEDERRVLLEVIGFWTPEYLKQKEETLRAFNRQRILLAVAQSSSERLSDLEPNMIVYKTVIKVEDVLERLRATKK